MNRRDPLNLLRPLRQGCPVVDLADLDTAQLLADSYIADNGDVVQGMADDAICMVRLLAAAYDDDNLDGEFVNMAFYRIEHRLEVMAELHRRMTKANVTESIEPANDKDGAA